jgi:hypothetical protein
MNLTSRALTGASVLLLCASSVRAAQYTLVGKVTAAVPALAGYGVTAGARVDVTWTVDLSTPVTTQSPAPDNKSDYQGAIDFLVIQIGTWQAVLIAPPILGQNIVSVADASGGPLDLLHVSTPGTDENHELHGVSGPLVLSLDFYAPNGGASSDQGLDQDPNSYPIGSGSAFGPGGYVTFSFNTSGSSGGGSGDPTAKCVTTQMKSAAAMCQSQFKCQASFAKAPLRDPGATKRDDCVDKAGQKFTAAYNKAAVTAAGKGLTCGTTAPAADVRVAIAARVEGVVADVGAITLVYPPLVSSWLTAAGAACGAGLKAEAADAAKPNPTKLAAARAKGTDKLTSTASKAVLAAQKKQIVFDSPPDVPAFVESVDALIDDTAAQLD